jgi:hypothetical protein
VNFDVGEVLTRAWQITWKHKVLWVFNMFPVLLSFLFIPIVFIPMFFIGPNALSSIVTLPFMAPFFFLPLIVESSQTGFNFQVFGWILLAFSLVLLPILALVQGFSLAFMKSAFMIIYLRLTRSTVLQPASL